MKCIKEYDSTAGASVAHQQQNKTKFTKMKSMILVALALVAVVAAAPTDKTPQILRSDLQQQPEGDYSFNFETENGINRQETGVTKEVLDEENKPHVVVVVRGSYTYVDNDGKPETISYYADETGYHAEGDSIPKAPAASR